MPSYKITCYEPALKIKECEGGWRLPLNVQEELVVDDECTQVEPITGTQVEVYCNEQEVGTNLSLPTE